MGTIDFARKRAPTVNRQQARRPLPNSSRKCRAWREEKLRQGFKSHLANAEASCGCRGHLENLAFRQTQCERVLENQTVPFVLSLSKHERNRYFEVP